MRKPKLDAIDGKEPQTVEIATLQDLSLSPRRK
jgi:hypothetical protein